MKLHRILVAGLALCLALSAVSCKKQKTYAEQLREMENSITAFMKKNGYLKIDTFPSTLPWTDSQGNELFYHTSSGLYLHVVDTGSTSEGVRKGQIIAVRYIERSVKADTVTYSNWSISYPPQEICKGYVNTGGNSNYYWGDCEAWHEALEYVGDYGHVKMIVPCALGMPVYNNSNTEMLAHFYELKYTFWR